MKLKGKIITSVTVLLLAAAALFVYIKFYYVFGEGVKAGELNFVVYKGYLWKTYEAVSYTHLTLPTKARV